MRGRCGGGAGAVRGSGDLLKVGTLMHGCCRLRRESGNHRDLMASPSPAWPPILGVFVEGCEGSSSLVRTTRALLNELGAPDVVSWPSEPFNPNQWSLPAACNGTARRMQTPGPRLQCLYRLARKAKATYVVKVTKRVLESGRAGTGLLAACRALGVPILVYARESALQTLACGVRDCFDAVTGGDEVATLVDANAQPLPLCRRFNRSNGVVRGPVDAVRTSMDAGARVRIVTTDPIVFCARLTAIAASKRVANRVKFLQLHELDAHPVPATFEQLHLDTDRPRRAATWTAWLAHGVAAIARMPRSRVESTISAILPPAPSPPAPPVWAQYEDPGALYALADAGGCTSSAAIEF